MTWIKRDKNAKAFHKCKGDSNTCYHYNKDCVWVVYIEILRLEREEVKYSLTQKTSVV